MKTYLWILVLFATVSACSSAATPTVSLKPELLQPATPTVSPTPELLQPITQAATSPALKYYPLDTMTQIEEIDVILAAVASGDVQEIRNLFRFTAMPCKTVNALGGPPACRDGEAQGTMVEVLPFLGSEGSFLRKDEVGNFPGLRVIGVYAVYKASELAYSEENYPAGDYGLVFVADQNVPGVVLQVKDGEIIRIDYIYNISSLSEILKRDAAAMILEPQS